MEVPNCFGWQEPNDLPYFWPFNRRNKQWVENVCYGVLAKELLKEIQSHEKDKRV